MAAKNNGYNNRYKSLPSLANIPGNSTRIATIKHIAIMVKKPISQMARFHKNIIGLNITG